MSSIIRQTDRWDSKMRQTDPLLPRSLNPLSLPFFCLYFLVFFVLIKTMFSPFWYYLTSIHPFICIPSCLAVTPSVVLSIFFPHPNFTPYPHLPISCSLKLVPWNLNLPPQLLITTLSFPNTRLSFPASSIDCRINPNLLTLLLCPSITLFLPLHSTAFSQSKFCRHHLEKSSAVKERATAHPVSCCPTSKLTPRQDAVFFLQLHRFLFFNKMTS